MNARWSSISLRSWMSVAVPTQNSISPASSRIGTARPRCQRYVAVAGAEAVLDLERLAAHERLLAPRSPRPGRSSGWTTVVPRVRPGLVRRHAGVLEPAAVEVRRAAVGRPTSRRSAASRRRAARYRSSLARSSAASSCSCSCSACSLQLPVLLPQLDEDRDLRAQDRRVDRLEDVVDRAGRVAAVDVRAPPSRAPSRR